MASFCSKSVVPRRGPEFGVSPTTTHSIGKWYGGKCTRCRPNKPSIGERYECVHEWYGEACKARR